MQQTMLSTKDITLVAVFAAIISICSWISIPTTVPFTLQTFAVFLTCMVLGGKRGTLAVIIYVLLGCIGLPVFSGFSGGLGVILGMTGGYIVGFIFSALVMWGFEKIADNIWMTAVSMIVALFVCYGIGTIWFMIVYANTSGSIGIMSVLGWCVIPFIIPDIIKIIVALELGKRLKKVLSL